MNNNKLHKFLEPCKTQQQKNEKIAFVIILKLFLNKLQR